MELFVLKIKKKLGKANWEIGKLLTESSLQFQNFPPDSYRDKIPKSGLDNYKCFLNSSTNSVFVIGIPITLL